MRSMIASLAVLSIACGIAVSAAASEPPTIRPDLEPLETSTLDGVRAGFVGFGFPRNLGLSDLISPGGTAQGPRLQQGRLILDADLNTAFGKVLGFGDGIRGRMTLVSSTFPNATPGDYSVNRAGLRHADRETDFDLVSRAAMRHSYKVQWSN